MKFGQTWFNISLQFTKDLIRLLRPLPHFQGHSHPHPLPHSHTLPPQNVNISLSAPYLMNESMKLGQIWFNLSFVFESEENWQDFFQQYFGRIRFHPCNRAVSPGGKYSNFFLSYRPGPSMYWLPHKIASMLGYRLSTPLKNKKIKIININKNSRNIRYTPLSASSPQNKKVNKTIL